MHAEVFFNPQKVIEARQRDHKELDESGGPPTP